jgi:hypothetical protein
MSELRQNDDDYSPGKDMPAEAQIMASAAELLRDQGRYLRWQRLARADSDRIFSHILNPAAQHDADAEEDSFEAPVIGITPDEGIVD